MRRCLEHFEEIIGTPFLESELDMVLLTLNDLGWDVGDRNIHCVTVRVDLQPLDQTVVGSGL